MENRRLIVVILLGVFILALFFGPKLLYHFSPTEQLSIKSGLDNFTPSVITTTTASVLFRDTWTHQITSTTRIITEIAEPTEIKDVSADIKALVLSAPSDVTTRCVESLKSIVGEDISVIDITKAEEIEPNVWSSYGAMAVFKIESAIRLTANAEIAVPVVLFLDNKDTLLAVFSWPYPNPSEEELMALANIGLGYYGVYVPLPRSYGIQILTNDQKQMIADALKPIYKINIYTR